MIWFDAVGKAGISRSLRALKRGATYVPVSFSGGVWSLVGGALRQNWISLTGAAKVVGGVPRPAPGDLAFLKELVEAGKLRTVIDRTYSLDEIAEAHRHAERGHKKGHVVIVFGKSRQGPVIATS